MRLRHLLSCAALALAATAQAQAPRIAGLDGFEPVPATMATPAVRAGTLEIPLQDGRRLTVAPWPALLPQRFGRQTVEAVRQMSPAGPSDRLSFTRPSESRPWLLVGTGTRSAAPLVGSWRLQGTERGWTVSDGARRKAWKAGVPLVVTVGRERWCLYLLDVAQPAPRAGVAVEGEPQLAWAAVRQKGCARQR